LNPANGLSETGIEFLLHFAYIQIMRVLVAPDSFKGTLSAFDVARCMTEGVRRVLPDARVVEAPVADGGEGTVEVLVSATGGRMKEITVTGPLGTPVRARWGILGDGKTAVIEMAAASGLNLIPEGRRNPLITTTFGTGQLIRETLNAGVRKIIVGLGGSGTNDGGAGMAEALGVRLLDVYGNSLGPGGAALQSLDRIDLSQCDPRLDTVEIIGACDVDNVLCGPAGASKVYGPQKGATSEQVLILDRALTKYAEVLRRTLDIDVSPMKGAGAAGGLGAGLVAFCHARLQRGIAIVLDVIGFDACLNGVDAVLTGEGALDRQLKDGKALSGVLERCACFSVPVYAVVGRVEGPPSDYRGKGMFEHVLSLVTRGTSVKEAMQNARALLRDRTAQMVQIMMKKKK
jgi:glycerate kinase